MSLKQVKEQNNQQTLSECLPSTWFCAKLPSTWFCDEAKSPTSRLLQLSLTIQSWETRQDGVMGCQKVGLRKDQRQCWHHGGGRQL